MKTLLKNVSIVVVFVTIITAVSLFTSNMPSFWWGYQPKRSPMFTV